MHNEMYQQQLWWGAIGVRGGYASGQQLQEKIHELQNIMNS